MLIWINSILHMLIDGICAFAMTGYYSTRTDWYLNILLYNFCAFALQMPFGFAMDVLRNRRDSRYLSYIVTVSGVILTVVGAWTHPIVLGVGNALFHIGGGVCTIREDLAGNRKGRLLGVFVAPGAFGLFLGKVYGGATDSVGIVPVIAILAVLALLIVLLYRAYAKEPLEEHIVESSTKSHDASCGKGGWVLALCFVVVILRSHVGLSLNFSWNTTFVYGLILVLATVLGKMAGGFAAALNKNIAIALSLILAAVCFVFGSIPVLGILAVFLFNMTMPITLYELVTTFKGMEGGMFGVLTFALFIGFLPTYLQAGSGGNSIVASGACIVSLILLLTAVRMGKEI